MDNNRNFINVMDFGQILMCNGFLIFWCTLNDYNLINVMTTVSNFINMI